MRFPAVLILTLAQLTGTPELPAKVSYEDYLEYARPWVNGYYLPVLREDIDARQIGRPVVDVFLNNEGKVIKAELLTDEFQNIEETLLRSVATNEYRPAYVEGARTEGFLRFPVQSYFFLDPEEERNENISTLPRARFRFPIDTMEKLSRFAELRKLISCRFHINLNEEGTVTEFGGIGDNSIEAERFLDDFAKYASFVPAELDGKPVPCSLVMQLSRTSITLRSTTNLLAQNLEQEQRPLPKLPEFGDVRYGVEHSIGLNFDKKGSVGTIQMISAMNPGEALEAFEAFRTWKISEAETEKFEGALRITYRYEQGSDKAVLLKEKPGQFLKPPEPKRLISPQYPVSLRLYETSGWAVVKFLVDKKGNVKFPELLSASHYEFGQESMNIIGKWKYEPAKLDGKPITVIARTVVPFRFNK